MLTARGKTMKFQREPKPRYWPSGLVLLFLLVKAFNALPWELSNIPFAFWFATATYAAVISFAAGDALALVSTVLVFGLIGAHSSTLALDLPFAILVSGVAVCLRMTVPAIQRRPILVCLATLVATSLVLTITDHLKPSQLIARSNESVKFQGTVKVGLALSGGGYRAAMLHAGVLDGLRAFGIPVSSIASVSGGSIAATAYWEGVQPLDLVKGVVAGKFSLYRKMLDLHFIAGYTFVAPWPARRYAQESVLDDTILNDQLFGGMACPEGSACAGRPKLMLIATDLANGTAVGFTPQGVLIRRTASAETPPGLFDNMPPITEATFLAEARETARWFPGAREPKKWPANIKASALVAASGAFPGAFEPYTMGESLQVEYHQLSDGGVSDNSAITLLLDADLFARNCTNRALFGDLLDWRQDVVIESDGTMPYNTTSPPRMGEIGTVLNAIDAAYARVLPRPLYLEAGVPADLRRPATILLTPIDVASPPDGSVVERRLTGALREIAEKDKDNARATFRMITRATGYSKDISATELQAMATDSVGATPPDSDGGFPDIQNLNTAIASDAKAFYEAPTLVASYEPQNAYHIYRLGWLLVALNSAHLHAAMATTASTGGGAGKEVCPGFGNR